MTDYDEDTELSREPRGVLLLYNTDHYQKYDWLQDAEFTTYAPKFVGSFRIYDDFKLLTGPAPRGLQIEETPYGGIRLDDKWVGLVSSCFGRQDLWSRWPAEFDNKGWVKASRIPLGDPCLVFVKKGQKDVDGIPATKTGCYYAWHRGVQLLCGAAGLKAGLFRVRLQEQTIKWEGLGFKVDYMADYSPDQASFRVISTAEGDRLQRIPYA